MQKGTERREEEEEKEMGGREGGGGGGVGAWWWGVPGHSLHLHAAMPLALGGGGQGMSG